MSNRLMGLLIVLTFILAGIAFYMYSFVTYTGKVVITTNVENYSVELKNIKTLKKIKKDCNENKCELNEVPPFEFKMVISKEGYRDYEEIVIVERSEVKSLVVAMQKDTKLVGLTEIGEVKEITGTGEVEIEVLQKKEKNIVTKEVSNGEDKKVLSKKEKIQRFNNRRNYYKHFEISNFGEIYFKQEGQKMNVYYKDELAKQRKISHFMKKAEKSQIRVLQVIGEDHKVFIQYGEENFLYNAKVASFDEIGLKIPVIYIKVGINRDLQFVTQKGTFIYKSKKFEYFSMFEDFVYRDGNYIGIIKSDDIRRKKNLNFDSENGTLIVLQNPESKEKKILLKPNFSVVKIFLRDNKVVIESREGKEFSLENF